jgi:hypothetical protein
MKRLFTILFITGLFISGNMFSQNEYFTEKWNDDTLEGRLTGTSADAPQEYTEVNSSTGFWQARLAYRAGGTGRCDAEGRTLRLVKVDVAKGFGGGIITPSLSDGVGSISFIEGRGGLNRVIEVAKSDNEGLTWEVVTTLEGTEMCVRATIHIDDLAANRIRLENKGTGDVDLDDIIVTKYVATSVEEEIIPTEFSLNQNYPNPFNPSTTINFSLPKSSFVQLRVYDHLGREVSSLINNELPAGVHSINWNSADNLSSFASGIYFIQLRADNFVKSIKAVLMK